MIICLKRTIHRGIYTQCVRDHVKMPSRRHKNCDKYSCIYCYFCACIVGRSNVSKLFVRWCLRVCASWSC